MLKKVIVLIVLCVFYGSVLFAAEAESLGLVGKERQDAITKSIKGEWIGDVGSVQMTLSFGSDGDCQLNGKDAHYHFAQGDVLVITNTDDSTGLPYTYELSGEKLVLTGKDIGKGITFYRRPDAKGFLLWLFDTSSESMMRTGSRIGLIVLVAAIARLLLIAMRKIVYRIIYSERGVLKYVYRTQKNRAMTIYSLVLNLLKYAIYVVAIGFVLTEMGVNYTAYLASLSVVGLAIGFGAQGLVQDMVTGLFIVVEGQFFVGDMVEVGSTTGIVEEIGLRMTRLRNYLGQKVVVPNRNITTVGVYRQGGQEAYVDVAMKSHESAERAMDAVREFGEEFSRQYAGVVRGSIALSNVLPLDTEEHFLRLQLKIWPSQQWVIDQQFVPRLKELLTNAGFEIPADRVVVFYHPKEERTR